MEKNKRSNNSVLSSYWQAFRMIFVFFALYLLGYSFYLWDGFSLYGSFPDFMLSMCLASVIISIIAALISAMVWFVWMLLRIPKGFFNPPGNHIKIGSLALPALLVITVFEAAFKSRPFLFPHLSGIYANLATVFILVTAAILPILITWLIRGRLVKIVEIIQERITPLVWVFGLFVAFSTAAVSYVTLSDREGNNAGPQRVESSPQSQDDRRNILLITFDALAKQNMSLYGYDRETTPFIAEWAKNATVFTKAEAASDYTSPTTATLMTGKRIWTHQLYRAHGYDIVDARTENLPLLLKNNGYYNIALVQNNLAAAETSGIAENFNINPLPIEFIQPQSIYSILEKYLSTMFGKKFRIYNIFTQQYFLFDYLLLSSSRMGSVTEYPPEKVFDKFIDIIENKIHEPYFAWLHLFPPHAPFLPPYPFMGMFDPSSKLRTVRSQIYGIYYPENIAVTKNRYDEFIRYCDKTFENFIKELTRSNKLQNTVIILSADHGESFDHNALTHGTGHLYESVTNIPLVIMEPGQNRGLIIRDLVRQIDIAPTILDLAGINVPSWMEGRSMMPLLRDEKLPPVYGISMHIESTPKGQMIEEGTFAVWEGDYKLIHNLEEDKSKLFNLSEDPEELANLFNEEPETGNQLLNLIKLELAKVNESIARK